ncbi:MAG: hypothetical protein GTN84_14265 [Hydrogenophaga sp.]|uniref:hypothetical protein n=1 Tax=Hydrogenophaga sp. TaxID=1904254 RepID=UPI0016B12EE5|nr:hypothetical protein [Hydrogenophaga sp.]NIM40200.1 hypothetical protein [Hydrogenophaga sp.]NIN25434.1 hypothetical protein [Hydrogenophaga sp.]NIN32291.1 hypothetical protein [Hydrogenophaga sp.]NIN56540.1 hypothetical protein [Hydrogenophaga sp.]NIO52849.1 hypothetical protein [Hydrogenophaga sp.]
MKIQWSEEYEFVQTPEPTPDWALRELALELQRLKIDINVRLLGVPDAFPDGGWCIHKEDDIWLVYHSERGRRSGAAIFTSSFDAANFYLWSRVAHPRNDNSDVGMLPRLKK